MMLKRNRSIALQIFFCIFFLVYNSELYSRPHLRFSKKHKVQYNGPTRILVAKNFYLQKPEEKIFRTKAYTLKVYSRKFAQANAIYFEIKKRKADEAFYKRPQLSFNQHKIPVSTTSWGYRALFGVSPKKKEGYHKINIKVHVASIENDPYIYEKTHNIWIRKTDFPVSKGKIYIRNSRKNASKKLSYRQKQKIKRFSREKARAFRYFSDEIFIRSTLAHPRNRHFITSPFWSTRFIARFKKRNNRTIQIRDRIRIHKGLDLRARTGAPIYAMADGKIIISTKMFYEGNFILIDHGQGIMSGYMHLSKRYVYKGNIVRARQQIGRAGATGAVTGAHLHLLLHIRGVPVDPLSLLSLPIHK